MKLIYLCKNSTKKLAICAEVQERATRFRGHLGPNTDGGSLWKLGMRQKKLWIQKRLHLETKSWSLLRNEPRKVN